MLITASARNLTTKLTFNAHYMLAVDVPRVIRFVLGRFALASAGVFTEVEAVECSDLGSGRRFDRLQKRSTVNCDRVFVRSLRDPVKPKLTTFDLVVRV